MRILFTLVLALALMAGLALVVAMAGTALAGAAGQAVDKGPVRSGLVPRVAFILLWVLIFGVSLGMIGSL